MKVFLDEGLPGTKTITIHRTKTFDKARPPRPVLSELHPENSSLRSWRSVRAKHCPPSRMSRLGRAP